MKRIVIVTGGTGGHIFPAMACGRYLEGKGWEVFYIFSGTKLEVKEKLRVFKIKSASPLVGSVKDRIISLILVLKSTFKSVRILRKLKPDCVLATGSYASFPPIVASLLLRIPFYLLEQNVLPGVVTRIFSKYAQATFISFEKSKEYLKGNLIHTGNPLRQNVLVKVDPASAKEKLGLPRDKKIILVIGGSLGAKFLIENIFTLIPEFPEYYFVLQTGTRNFEYFKTKYGKKGKNFILLPFIEEMGLYYSASYLVISRAGAGAVTEIAYHSLPAILVPYPHSRDRHQFYNAKVLAERGAALIVEEKEGIHREIAEILKNSELIESMRGKGKKIYKEDTFKIIEEVLEKNGISKKD